MKDSIFELEEQLNDLRSPDERKEFIEQYKLLIDGVNKFEERRQKTNEIFLTINSILAGLITVFNPLKEGISFGYLIFVFITLIGFILSIEWLLTIYSYYVFNHSFFNLIKVLEQKYFVVPVFTLRGELVAKKPYQVGNIILLREALLPVAFLIINFISLMVTLLL